MTFETIMNYIINNFLVPIAFIFIGTLCIWAKNKISEVLTKLTENSDKEVKTVLMTNALTQLDDIISSVVSKNQILSDEYKKANADGKLTAEEKESLKNTAIQSINELIPTTITSDDILGMLGGQEVLDKLISDGIEKSLIQIKKNK